MARNFKSDESFLEKISIGAIGTKKVYEDLVNHNHRPIELERGSMSYKIWKSIKIKRIRVPDLLCVDCGKRIESRAKTKLEITMSHSINERERAWDFGLSDNDYVALVVCEKSGERPVDWIASDLVQYIKVSDLKKAFIEGSVKQETPKGAQEGYETRITWFASKASSDGIISYISNSDDTKPKIQFKRNEDNRTITLSLRKGKQNLIINPIVVMNDNVKENEIIASVVPVSQHFVCEKNIDSNYYGKKLDSISLSERYASAKALSYFDINEEIIKLLKSKLDDEDEHIYVKLECAATLSRNGINKGYDFINHCITSDYLVDKLEAVIVCSEIKSTKSFKLLTNCLLDENQNHEIRAGAAWALGEMGYTESIKSLVNSFNAFEPIIKIEAARALAKLSKENTKEVIPFLKSKSQNEIQGTAWAISKSDFDLKDLLPFLNEEETRVWISYILGVQDKEKYLTDIEELKKIDSEVYFAVTVLWKIMESWIYRLEEY